MFILEVLTAGPQMDRRPVLLQRVLIEDRALAGLQRATHDVEAGVLSKAELEDPVVPVLCVV